MKKNMGALDRGIRIVIAIIIGDLYFMDKINGILAIVLGIFSVIFIATSFIGSCPLYKPIGIRTTRSINKKEIKHRNI